MVQSYFPDPLLLSQLQTGSNSLPEQSCTKEEKQSSLHFFPVSEKQNFLVILIDIAVLLLFKKIHTHPPTHTHIHTHTQQIC